MLMLTGWPILAAQEGAERKKPPTYLEFLFQPKFMVMLAIGILVLFLLKSRRMSQGLKVAFLLLATLLFGIIGNVGIPIFSSFSMHPSPMCAAGKPFLFGFRVPFMAMLTAMALLTLIGPKLFCGWICPVGAVQELIAMAADKMKLVRKKINYSISYGIRMALFLFFLITGAAGLITMTVKDQIIPFNIYDRINPFHGFEFHFGPTFLDNLILYLPFLLTVVLAFKLYRPFCHFVCPFGLYAHFLEQIGIFRVSLNKKKCTNCNICVKKSPCQAVPSILNETELRPECYSCDDCLRLGPEDALTYGIKKAE